MYTIHTQTHTLGMHSDFESFGLTCFLEMFSKTTIHSFPTQAQKNAEPKEIFFRTEIMFQYICIIIRKLISNFELIAEWHIECLF